MTPLLQSNRKLPYLFIALLLACFAIAQSARAVTPEPDRGDPNGNTAEEETAVLELSTGAEDAATGQQATENQPNKRVIRFNVRRPLQCAGGNVTVGGELLVTFRNVPDLEVVPASLKLEGFRGTAASGARKLEVKQQDVKFSPFIKVDTGLGEGKFGIEFKVTGPGLPGGTPLRFRVTLSPIVYKFRDGKVTKIIPDDTPVVRCSN